MLLSDRPIPFHADFTAIALALGFVMSPVLAQEFSGAERQRIDDIIRADQGVLMPLDGALGAVDQDSQAPEAPMSSEDVSVESPADEAGADDGEPEVATDQPEPEVDETELADTAPQEVPEETPEDTMAISEPSGEDAADEAIVEAPELVTDEFVAEDPVEEEIVAEDLAVAEPVVDEPADDEPAVEEPTEEVTVADDLAASEPADEEPGAEEPAEEEIAVEDMAATEPVDDEPAVEDPAVEEPVAEEPVEVESASEDLAVLAPADDNLTDDEPIEQVAVAEPFRTAELGNPESIGPYRLWLASYKTVRQAKDGWRELAEANQDLLADLTPIIVLKDLGSEESTFFRLQAGPLQSQGSANTRCTALIQRDIYCSVLGP